MANQDRQVLLDTIHEMDIELRQAARAGLLLLEKNEDLEAQVDRARFQQREASMEADTLREQRKTAVLEVNAALTRIKELEEQLRHDRAAHQAVQDSFLGKIDALQSELRKAYKKTTQTLPEKTKEEFKNDEDDPRLALLQLDKTRLKRQLQDANEHIVALERAMLQLTMEKKTMEEEQMEERALIRDLQQINREYQKVVDAQASKIWTKASCRCTTTSCTPTPCFNFGQPTPRGRHPRGRKEDDEQHWTMGYPVLRGLLVGMQSVWHTMVSCTAQWFASWTSSSSPTMNAPDDVPRGCIPDVVSNAFPSFASSDDNGSVDFSLSNYEPPEDTENRVDELSPVDAQPHVVVQDNVSVMDGQPSSVQRHECIHGLMAGIHSVWLVWLRTMSCTLSWTRGKPYVDIPSSFLPRGWTTSRAHSNGTRSVATLAKEHHVFHYWLLLTVIPGVVFESSRAGSPCGEDPSIIHATSSGCCSLGSLPIGQSSFSEHGNSKSTPIQNRRLKARKKMANQDRQVLLDTIHEMDIELRQAARAGLLLLEKNEDLEAQVDQQRKTAVLEVNAALTRIKELEEQLRHDRAAHQAVQDSFLGKIDALQSELRKAYKKTTQTLPEKTKEEFKNDEDDPRLALLQLDKTRLKRQLQDALKKLRRLDIESTERRQQPTNTLWLSSAPCFS
ncbi:hypothetical protein Ae201684P_010271 [Aphanomyces euteiches]|nr:hypothetical protein Ae201684P_010271 [Aphanomyces euteiches]